MAQHWGRRVAHLSEKKGVKSKLCKKFSKKLIQEKQFLLQRFVMSIVAISHPGLKKSCFSACPLSRQLANLFCLPRAVAPISKFKINIEDDLHGPLPIRQLQCTS